MIPLTSIINRTNICNYLLIPLVSQSVVKSRMSPLWLAQRFTFKLYLNTRCVLTGLQLILSLTERINFGASIFYSAFDYSSSVYFELVPNSLAKMCSFKFSLSEEKRNVVLEYF